MVKLLHQLMFSMSSIIHHVALKVKKKKKKKIISFKEQQPINEEQKKQNLDTISVGNNDFKVCKNNWNNL